MKARLKDSKTSAARPAFSRAVQPAASREPFFVQRKCDCQNEEKETAGLQMKLTVGAPNDRFEREADAVADRVVQRMESDSRPPIEDEREETLQAKPEAGGPSSSGAARAAAAVSNGGRRLSGSERAFFEPGFGRDFSQVRVHDHPAAGAAARAIGARAYTLGSDIGLAPGAYSPGEKGSQRLLAHELTHVLQQNGDVTIRRVPPTPTALPATVPPAGATDFRVNRVGTSTTSRIFFARGASTLDAGALGRIAAIKSAPPASVRIIGYRSMDEASSVAQDRANAVRTVLTAAPNPVTVSSAVGDPTAMESRSDFTGARSAEILVGAAAPATLNCVARDVHGNLINPPKQPCPTMDPPTWTAFNAALPIANNAMTRAVAAVAGAPTAGNAAVIDRFFGNHGAATLTALRTNLGRLRTHVSGLPAITKCGGQCDIGKCSEGPIGYNNGVDAASRMTLCVPAFKGMHVNDRARNLIHESAHGTSPLGGAPGTGTSDVAYRHERMLFHLAPAERLRNSDSYALFAMFLREVQTTGLATAVPAGISTPATDALTGFGADEPALSRALARLEKRLTWATDWVGQLYGEVDEVRAGRLAWAGSWARGLMTEAAARFPLNPPTVATTATDQTRIAAILDRYERMKMAVKTNLTVTRMAAGVVSWPKPPAWVAGSTLSVGPDFFTATADDQVSLLLEHLVRATHDVEPAFVPAYVSLAAWIHSQNP